MVTTTLGVVIKPFLHIVPAAYEAAAFISDLVHVVLHGDLISHAEVLPAGSPLSAKELVVLLAVVFAPET